MRTEAQCPPVDRYLYADRVFSDNVIKFWQQECIRRCAGRDLTAVESAYSQYVNWERSEDEIAVFTGYAYADFAVPKKFNGIFRFDNPQEHLLMDYELTQGIWEAWFPMNGVDHGHKHLCIFKFNQQVPDIFNLLQVEKNGFANEWKNLSKLGFCQAEDLPAISERLTAVVNMRAADWWNHNEEQQA